MSEPLYDSETYETILSLINAGFLTFDEPSIARARSSSGSLRSTGQKVESKEAHDENSDVDSVYESYLKCKKDDESHQLSEEYIGSEQFKSFWKIITKFVEDGEHNELTSDLAKQYAEEISNAEQNALSYFEAKPPTKKNLRVRFQLPKDHKEEHNPYLYYCSRDVYPYTVLRRRHIPTINY